MSATGISAISLSQINPPFVIAGQGQQLKSSLQAGDLVGAQQAFNALSALHDGNGPFKDPALARDFAAIGTALQAGDLAGAQQAAATLQRAIHQNINQQGGGGSVNPEVILRISPAASAATSAPSAPSASASSPAAPTASSVAPITSKGGSTSGSGAPTSTSAPEIVLNVNAGAAQQVALSLSNSSSGEQVNLSVGNGSGSAEQIQLNLAQNEALQINLIA
jgi:hypothetical protein